MKILHLFLLVVAVAVLPACSKPPEVAQDSVGCASNHCIRLDELPLSSIPRAIEGFPGYSCLPTDAVSPVIHICLREQGAEVQLAWLGAAPSSILTTHVDGKAAYVELQFARNEFDRFEHPMLLHFGKPTKTSFIPYRNNAMPSRLHSWETQRTLLTLFDNSASTSVQISYK